MALDKRSQLRRANALLVNKVFGEFFGTIKFKMEHGNISYVYVLESHKPLTEDPDAVIELVQKFLDGKFKGDPDTEITLKYIRGKPHVVFESKGALDDIVDMDVIETAESLRRTAIR